MNDFILLTQNEFVEHYFRILMMILINGVHKKEFVFLRLILTFFAFHFLFERQQ